MREASDQVHRMDGTREGSPLWNGAKSIGSADLRVRPGIRSLGEECGTPQTRTAPNRPNHGLSTRNRSHRASDVMRAAPPAV